MLPQGRQNPLIFNDIFSDRMDLIATTTQGLDNAILSNLPNHSNIEKSDDCSLATVKIKNVTIKSVSTLQLTHSISQTYKI